MLYEINQPFCNGVLAPLQDVLLFIQGGTSMNEIVKFTSEHSVKSGQC